ncbi:MAG: PH domain-containing protein [Bacteroidia bacterium]|nr:PH domain-containing protein [Bacteroidia bacterium]
MKFIKADSKTSLKKLTIDEVRLVIEKPIELPKSTGKDTIPATKTRIELQLENIGYGKSLFGRKEIAELPNLIIADEEIFAIVQGMYNESQGILVGTNKRLLFVDKGLIYGLKVEDFGLDKITSIQYQSGIMFAELTILASGNTAKISQLVKNEAKTFADKARQKLSDTKLHTSSVQVAQQPLDIADQLEKLANLKEKGILTQAEFDSQKKKLLGL